MTDTERQRLAFIARLREDPLDATVRGVFADWLDEHEPDQGEWAALLRAGRIPWTEVDDLAINLLSGCTFLPASFEKRFVRNIADLVADGHGKISLTPKQYALVWKLCHNYRRQIGRALIVNEAARVHKVVEAAKVKP